MYRLGMHSKVVDGFLTPENFPKIIKNGTKGAKRDQENKISHLWQIISVAALFLSCLTIFKNGYQNYKREAIFFITFSELSLFGIFPNLSSFA